MRSPKGHVQGTNRPIDLGNGMAVHGRFPMLVVELRVESQRNRNDIAFWSRKLGLELREVQEIAPGSLVAFEAWGAPDALERFTTFRFVQSFHLPVACRVGFIGQGGGHFEPKHRKPLPHVREALRREDDRADAACAARRMGHDDGVRRERLFA